MSLRKLAMIAAISSAALTTFATPAQAADRYLVGDVVLFVHSDDPVSSRSRAEVMAEMIAARQAGPQSQWGDVSLHVVEVTAGPSRPREEVRKEAIAASRAGTLSRGDVVLH